MEPHQPCSAPTAEYWAPTGRFTTGPRMVYTNQFHKLPTRSVPFT